jgi:hypothetical protein
MLRTASKQQKSMLESEAQTTSHLQGCGSGRASHAQGGYCTDMSLRLLSPLPLSDLLRFSQECTVLRLGAKPAISQVGAILYCTAAKLQISAISGTYACSHQPSNQRTISMPRPHGQPLGRTALICITGKPLSSWSWKCPVMMQCFCAAGIQ